MTDGLPIAIHALTYGTTWPEVEQTVRRIDELGFAALLMHDHLLATQGHPQAPFFEAWTTLAAWASITRRVRLGHLTLANALRNPGVVARAAVTVDHASGGRLILGLGAGWWTGELEAHGLPAGSTPGERLTWLEEAIVQVQRILGGETVSGGDHVRLQGVGHRPLPLQARVPILVGASGERRGIPIAARRADIWQTWVPLGDPEPFVRRRAILDAAARAAGRDPGTIASWPGAQVIIRGTAADAEAAMEARARVHGWPGDLRTALAPTLWSVTPSRFRDELRRYRDLGATTFVVTIMAPADPETLEHLASAASGLA